MTTWCYIAHTQKVERVVKKKKQKNEEDINRLNKSIYIDKANGLYVISRFTIKNMYFYYNVYAIDICVIFIILHNKLIFIQ